MDLNFGEILIDQSSRALYDDYDDLNLNRSFDRPQLKWTEENTNVPNDINRLIVIEGINARKILQTYVVKNIKALCTSRNMSVYQLVNDDILCVVEEQDLNYYSSMAQLIEEFQKTAKECIVLSLQPLSELKSDRIPDSCVIRGINSSFSDIPALSAPNFISGVAAGVVSSRVMNGKTFACYVIYVDLYDEQSIQTILNHFKRINLSYDESLKIKALHHKSDLYM